MTGSEVRARFPGETERIRAGEDIPRGVDGETWSELGQRVAAGLTDFAETLAARAGSASPSPTARPPGPASAYSCSCRSSTGGSSAGMANCAWAVLDEQAFGWRLIGWNLVAM